MGVLLLLLLHVHELLVRSELWVRMLARLRPSGLCVVLLHGCLLLCQVSHVCGVLLLLLLGVCCIARLCGVAWVLLLPLLG